MLIIHTKQQLPEYLYQSGIAISPMNTLPEEGVYLVYDEQGLALCKAGQKGRVHVDFTAGAAQYRRLHNGGELIAKAVNHQSKPIVWDMTGGLGRDAWVLASQGLSVSIFEQNPSVFLLLFNGLFLAKINPMLAEVASKINLFYGNAHEIAPSLIVEHGIELPDVVYLDPMYPERKKSAAVKKEMAYFHELVGQGNESDEIQLLETARKIAKKRVVVKRPRLGDFLCQQKPDYQYVGKSTRFDVYLPNG